MFVGNDAEEAVAFGYRAATSAAASRRRAARGRRRPGCAGSCAAAWCCRCCGCASWRRPSGSGGALGAAGAAAPELRGQPRAADRGRTGDHAARASTRSRAMPRRAARGPRSMLMPARFQVDDADYGRLRDAVRAGGRRAACATPRRAAVRRGARRACRCRGSTCCRRCARALPGPDLFFQQTVHLTPRGHEVVAEALERVPRATGLLTPPPAR